MCLSGAQKVGTISGETAEVIDDELRDILGVALTALERVVNRDWSLPVGSLEWTC
jgi:hypothetical protein